MDGFSVNNFVWVLSSPRNVFFYQLSFTISNKFFVLQANLTLMTEFDNHDLGAS